VPKFTKPYWVDRSPGGSLGGSSGGGARGRAADDSPSERRRIVDVAPPGDAVVDAKWPSSRDTVIDHVPPVPSERERRTSRHGFVESSSSPGHKDYANVHVIGNDDGDDADRAAGAKPTTAMVLASRRGGVNLPAHPLDPPHIVVARHELSDELATDPRLVLVRAPDSPQAAAYRVLRHQLSQKGDPRCLVVTSALRGEGKTTCAVNLALALGECARARVLLVEAHLRRPRLGAVFRFEPPWCFAQQLHEHRVRPEERWSVVEVAPHGLHVMAVDPRTEQRPLLDGPAFTLAMERMALAGYDYIVIDAPPVLDSAEVNLLQDAADGVLLTTRSRASRGRDLRKAVEQLSPGRISGVVLIDR